MPLDEIQDVDIGKFKDARLAYDFINKKVLTDDEVKLEKEQKLMKKKNEKKNNFNFSQKKNHENFGDNENNFFINNNKEYCDNENSFLLKKIQAKPMVKEVCREYIYILYINVI
jgi:hypothetical protein